jgi:hypothetical protein
VSELRPLLDKHDLARFLRCSVSWVEHAAASGLIECTPIAGRNLWTEEQAHRIVASRRKPATAQKPSAPHTPVGQPTEGQRTTPLTFTPRGNPGRRRRRGAA